jgi:hypothetical protein
MSLADDLLTTADRLVATPLATESDYWRAISTAYYALFHRLIEATAARLLSDTNQQKALARRFSHTEMKKVCQFVTKSPLPPHAAPFLTAPILPDLAALATVFVKLQELRHETTTLARVSVSPMQAVPFRAPEMHSLT